jgi:hypothetical protein
LTNGGLRSVRSYDWEVGSVHRVVLAIRKFKRAADAPNPKQP